MVYDPKKTRAKQKDVEAVVDEIFEEVSNKVDSKLETAKKTVETKISDKKQKIGGLVLASLGYFYNTQ